MKRIAVLALLLAFTLLLNGDLVPLRASPNSPTVNGQSLQMSALTQNFGTVSSTQSVPQAEESSSTVQAYIRPVSYSMAMTMTMTPEGQVQTTSSLSVDGFTFSDNGPAQSSPTTPEPPAQALIQPDQPAQQLTTLTMDSRTPLLPGQDTSGDTTAIADQPTYSLVSPRPDFDYNSAALDFVELDSFTQPQYGMGVGPGIQVGTVRYAPAGEF